jgi:hypothetical protein
MNARPKYFDGAQKNIDRRRDEEGGLDYLSDWQVHSANLVASDIKFFALGFREGPLYVSLPTGTGKTTGAIWGIQAVLDDNPDERICFLTPYQDSVDHVYEQLKAKLGRFRVGRYHGGLDVEKDEELKKQVIVLTHQFVPANKGRLDDRTLLIVDESIYATGEVSLRCEDFYTARTWATTHGVFADEFTQLATFVSEWDQALGMSGNKYLAPPSGASFAWAGIIANDLNLNEHGQTINNRDLLSSVQVFCEALLQGLAFASKGQLRNGRYDQKFSAAVLALPNLKRTVVLTATGGMTYDLAGSFSGDTPSAAYRVPPRYDNLKLVRLSGPSYNQSYGMWGSSTIKADVVTYVDWLLRMVPETELYLTMPKAVLEGCLLDYLGQQRAKGIEYPIMFQRHGKTVHISHHALSVGSNAFRDCEAVLYLWDNHLPQLVAVQRYHTLKGQPVTDEDLAEANNGKLTGNYKKIREAMYFENMMQQIGRGRVRTFDDNAVANPMTAYVLTTKEERFSSLVAQYDGCQMGVLLYKGFHLSSSSSRVTRVLNYIRQYGGGQDIPAKQVQTNLGYRLSSIGSALDHNRDLLELGYVFERGTKGRGRGAVFRYVGELIENPSAALPEQ